MNKTIKDLENIIRIHNLVFLYVSNKNVVNEKYAKVDPVQLAKYLYGVGYRKKRGVR